MEIGYGVLYNIGDLMPHQRNKYTFDLRLSDVSGSPRVERAICETFDQVLKLFKNETDFVKDWTVIDTLEWFEDEDNLKFYFTIVASFDHRRDYYLTIKCKLLQKEEFAKLTEIASAITKD